MVVDRLLGMLSLAAMGVAGVLVWTPAGLGTARVAAGVAVLTLALRRRRSGPTRCCVRCCQPIATTDRSRGGLLRVADAVTRYRDHRGTLAR